jgi:hypothetical protein
MENLPYITASNTDRKVFLPAGTKVATLTIPQLNAINRLGQNGWAIDLNEFALQSDGMLEGLMRGKGEMVMYVGIHPLGSTHT